MDVNSRNSYDMTALHMAAMNNHAKVVKRLLRMPGINANLVDKDGRSCSPAPNLMLQRESVAEVHRMSAMYLCTTVFVC